MKRIIAATLIVLLSIVSISASADDKPIKPTLIEEFQSTANFELLGYKTGVRIALLQIEAGEKTYAEGYSSILTGKYKALDALKKLFPKVYKSLSKKPNAQKALKEYYAAWNAAVASLIPDSDELKISYDKRQGDSFRHVEEMWDKFEIEASL